MASELKVNTIKKASGSTITVGESGDTVTLASGAVVSGGFKDIQWQSVITADGSTTTTAEAGKGYPIDTTSAAHTLNLPASPSVGDTVAVIDYAGTFGTNNVTVGRNGSNMQGAAANGTIATNRRAVTFVYIDSTKGWIPANDNTTDSYGAKFVTATGGTVTTSGDYKIHTFTSTSSLVVSCGGNTAGSDTVDYLVVAGGGSGGGGSESSILESAGGGAGGFRLSNSTCMPAPLTSPLASPTGISVSATTYPVTVGAGGASRTYPINAAGNDGSNSIFSTITSAGGGGGAAGFSAPANGSETGRNGGSGGGGGGTPSTATQCGGAGNTPPVSPPQGNPGGQGRHESGNFAAGGGGGGAGAVGGNYANPSNNVGNGGTGGIGSYVAGSGFGGCNGEAGPVCGARYFAAGGGGGSMYNDSSPTGRGGIGGGGDGGNGPGPVGARNAAAGTANTGSGGGGTGRESSGTSGAGGSGIVIIRYKFQ